MSALGHKHEHTETRTLPKPKLRLSERAVLWLAAFLLAAGVLAIGLLFNHALDVAVKALRPW